MTLPNCLISVGLGWPVGVGVAGSGVGGAASAGARVGLTGDAVTVGVEAVGVASGTPPGRCRSAARRLGWGSLHSRGRPWPRRKQALGLRWPGRIRQGLRAPSRGLRPVRGAGGRDHPATVGAAVITCPAIEEGASRRDVRTPHHAALLCRLSREDQEQDDRETSRKGQGAEAAQTVAEEQEQRSVSVLCGAHSADHEEREKKRQRRTGEQEQHAEQFSRGVANLVRSEGGHDKTMPSTPGSQTPERQYHPFGVASRGRDFPHEADLRLPAWTHRTRAGARFVAARTTVKCRLAPTPRRPEAPPTRRAAGLQVVGARVLREPEVSPDPGTISVAL